MFELLFLVALVAWLFFSALEFALSLPCAPTLIAACAVVPLLSVSRYSALARIHRLGRVRSAARPVPPERFFWPFSRRRLGARFTVALFGALALWPLAVVWPARWDSAPASVAGWICGALAIWALSEVLATGCLYVRASHWFNRQAPGFVGWVRRLLYRISDNHEFLGEEPLPRQQSRREKVY